MKLDFWRNRICKFGGSIDRHRAGAAHAGRIMKQVLGMGIASLQSEG
jgi:hypothetical protein